MLRASVRLFSTAEPSVIATSHNHVTEILLSRPKALNSLDIPMVHLLQKTVDELNHSEKTRVAVFSGAGPRAFCAGGDVRALYTAKKNNQAAPLRDFFWYEYILDHALAVMKPVQVAIYNGIVMGGGVGISIHAPIRIATESSVFAMPETAIGFFPDVGGSFFLPRLPEGLGLYLGLTGAKLTGKMLVSAGIATHFVESGKVEQLKGKLREKTTNATTLEDVKRIVALFAEPVREPLDHIDHIQRTFGSVGSVEEVVANLEKDFGDWAQKQHKILNSVSQLSLKVVYEQLKRGKTLSLPECFAQEFRLSQQFMNGTDFFEGVRASLVEKNTKPKWQYSSLSDIPSSVVQRHFEKVTPDQQDLDVRSP